MITSQHTQRLKKVAFVVFYCHQSARDLYFLSPSDDPQRSLTFLRGTAFVIIIKIERHSNAGDDLDDSQNDFSTPKAFLRFEWPFTLIH